MLIRPAELSEFDAVRRFYWDLIDNMAGAAYSPGWQKGIYPADDVLRQRLADGALYLCVQEDRIVGAMVFNHCMNTCCK